MLLPRNARSIAGGPGCADLAFKCLEIMVWVWDEGGGEGTVVHACVHVSVSMCAGVCAYVRGVFVCAHVYAHARISCIVLLQQSRNARSNRIKLCVDMLTCVLYAWSVYVYSFMTVCDFSARVNARVRTCACQGACICLCVLECVCVCLRSCMRMWVSERVYASACVRVIVCACVCV